MERDGGFTFGWVVGVGRGRLEEVGLGEESGDEDEEGKDGKADVDDEGKVPDPAVDARWRAAGRELEGGRDSERFGAGRGRGRRAWIAEADIGGVVVMAFVMAALDRAGCGAGMECGFGLWASEDSGCCG